MRRAATPPDGFREANHVRLYAKEFAGAPPGKFRAGFHFVEDEECTILVANVAQSLEKSRLRQAKAYVHHDGLENGGGDLAGIFAEAAFDACEIVEDRDRDIGDGSFGNASAAGNAGRSFGIAVILSFGLNANKSGIVQAVVAAFELQDLFAAGGGTRDAAGVHGDFGSARAEANHFDGVALADFFGKFPFLIVRHAESGATMKFLFDSFYHGGMTVASHQRTETQVVVNVFVAIEIVNTAALSILDKNRIRLVMAIVAGNAERNSLKRPFVRRGRFRRALLVSGKFLLQRVVHDAAPWGCRSVPCGQFEAMKPVISRARRRGPRAARA